MDGTFEFKQVPPPSKPPVDELAELYGLVRGLRVEMSRHGQWRCGECNKMQEPESMQVWVPDSVRSGDPEWSVTEACRRTAYNGTHTAWCLPCGQRLGHNDSRAAIVAPVTKNVVRFDRAHPVPQRNPIHDSWWARFWKWLGE